MKKINILIIITILLVFVALIFNHYQKSGGEGKNEIYVVTASPKDMRLLFANKQIDGALVHYPISADLVLNYNASYLLQSSEIWPNHPCCLLSTNMNDEDVIRALVWANLKAIEFINAPENESKVINYAVDFSGSDEEVIKDSLKHIKYVGYPNEEDVKKYYYKLKEASFFQKSLKEIGYENEEDFFSDLFNRAYYDFLEKNPNWKPNFIDKTVRLGYFPADLHHLPGYVALKEGYYNVFRKFDLTPFPQGLAVMEAYQKNLIDASYIGVPPLLLKQINSNIPVTIIGGANKEGSALVVKKDIESLEDLRGKTIAILGLGTMPDFLLRTVAEKAGLEFVLKK